MAGFDTLRFEEHTLILLDQRLLPGKLDYFECKTYQDTIFAIKDMVVRGAPAIGVAAAYGAALAAFQAEALDLSAHKAFMTNALHELRESRPTAVNLMWAVERMRKVYDGHIGSIGDAFDGEVLYGLFLKEAVSIHKEDVKTNRRMAVHGNTVVPHGARILTHCNAGALATAGYGTALGVIREAHASGKEITVFADETRPRLQGAKLTAWELVQENIPATLIADNTAASLIRDGQVDLILVGADRITANGDTANKIGTFMLSVIAKTYGVPFYIVAPVSTIDFDLSEGKEIEIEERDDVELTHVDGVRIAPEGIGVYNPAFDVTPNGFITGIITEKGILRPPYIESIAALRR